MIALVRALYYYALSAAIYIIIIILNKNVQYPLNAVAIAEITELEITPQESTGTEQLAYVKSIDMLNKNTQGAKKARSSRKDQLAFIHTCD